MMASECRCLIDIEKCGLVSVIIVALSFNQYTVYFMNLANEYIICTIQQHDPLRYKAGIRIISADIDARGSVAFL